MRGTRSIQENLENLYTVNPFTTMNATNSEKREQMKRFIAAVIDVALTERQKQIIEMYYLSNKKMREIAELLGISKPSVSITLKRAINNIEKNKKIFEKVKH